MRGDLGDGGIVMQPTTHDSKRSGACVGLLASVFLASVSLADENKPPLQLPDGGQVVSKVENQVRSKTCRAKREWVEVVGIDTFPSVMKISPAAQIQASRKCAQTEAMGAPLLSPVSG